MTVYIALLRAVNVGGTGKLPMTELRELCESVGLRDVRTYIQSGNVVFRTPLDREEARARIEGALERRMGKRVPVHLRTPSEMGDVVDGNPFAEAPGNRVLVYFLDEAWPDEVLAGIATPGGEELAGADRELFVHFPDGQGRSKLKLPHADVATGRNLNTVRRLRDLGRELGR